MITWAFGETLQGTCYHEGNDALADALMYHVGQAVAGASVLIPQVSLGLVESLRDWAEAWEYDWEWLADALTRGDLDAVYPTSGDTLDDILRTWAESVVDAAYTDPEYVWDRFGITEVFE